MKKSNGIIAYTIIIAIVIALIFFFQRSLYTQTNVTYSQYRSFVEEEKIAQAQIEQNAKVPTGSVLFFVSGSSTEYRVFVSDVNAELDRLQIGGVERRLRELGKRLNLPRVHPHKFRRTLATSAIDKGMPIEQVQQLLGHQKIDTTMHYAMVKQQNVKLAHRKYIG